MGRVGKESDRQLPPDKLLIAGVGKNKQILIIRTVDGREIDKELAGEDVDICYSTEEKLYYRDPSKN